MNKKILLSIVFILWLSGCSSRLKAEMPPDNYSRLEYNDQAVSKISVIDSPTDIKQGYNGSITIKGSAGTSYTITATYMENGNMLTARETRTAGDDGKVTWTWRVSRSTSPGTYPLVISGGGDTYVTSYIVTR